MTEAIPIRPDAEANCIFCKRRTQASRSVEHILAESFGNTEYVLPRGVVCDPCNNYFASSVEQPVLESDYFLQARFDGSVPNKRHRSPSINGVVLPQYHAEVSRDATGDLHVYVEEQATASLLNGRSRALMIPRMHRKPDPILFARFLGKTALETMAYKLLKNAPQILVDLLDCAALDPLRHYARYGSPQTLKWPYSERRIYAPDNPFQRASGNTCDVLHEWRFLSTEEGELYFILVLFGIECAINVGGPDTEGYRRWLSAHEQTSALNEMPH